MPPTDHDARMTRARLALDGLSIGDAFGEQFFHGPAALFYLTNRELPPTKWKYTDDTEMALGIYDVLKVRGSIDRDDLAKRFAQRFTDDPLRGYGRGAIRLLEAVAHGDDWQTMSKRLFGGSGSYGNGGAMRVAPVGAYFADDYDAVVEHARASAEVTHAHAEGQAGAIAVAVAAAFMCRRDESGAAFDRAAFFGEVLARTPDGDVRTGVRMAATLPPDTERRYAVTELGHGAMVTAQDTVPLCLWLAARHADDYVEAMWNTVGCSGDIDTNAAIVGGIVACSVGRAGLPDAWLTAREPLA